MTPAKGHHEAISALAELKALGIEAELKVVGGGENDYSLHCRELVEKLGLQSEVTFISSVESPWELLSETEIFLQCSQHEAFGRVTVEAMLSKTPVVAKNSGGTPEIIKDGVTGFLYNSEDELSSKILEALQHPSLSAITEKANNEALQRFNPKTIANQVFETYQSAL